MLAVPSDPTESMLGVLRSATGELHAALDARIALDRDDLTRDRYVTFLRASSAVALPLERELARWLEVTPVRTAALGQDLHALGSNLAPPATLLALGSLAQAMGALYVMEGSALGGSVLARVVAGRLGEGTPRAYFVLRGEGTGPRWREVMQSLESWGRAASEEERGAACATARAIFAAYASAFDAAGAFA